MHAKVELQVAMENVNIIQVLIKALKPENWPNLVEIPSFPHGY